jgi:hypothetical protein
VIRVAIVTSALLLAAAAARGQEWIPLTIRDGVPTFPVVLEGREATALLDSGSTGNSIDAAYVAANDIPLSGRRYHVTGAFSQDVLVRSVAWLDVRMFGLGVRLRDTPALEHPNTPLIIGATAIDGLVVQFDYPSSRMRILPPKAVDMGKNANLPLRAANGGWRPAIEVEFPGGEKHWLMLDTGSSGQTVITRAVARRLGLLNAADAREASSTDVLGSVAQLRVVTLPSLRIGPYELGNVPVAIPAEGDDLLVRQGRNAPLTGTHVIRGARVSGVVGYDVLRHFVITLDLAGMKAHIAAPAKTASN